MRALLIGLAAPLAVITLPAPAAADHRGSGSNSGGFVSAPGGSFHGDFGRGRHRGADNETVWVYDREYQGNSAWKSDSFNDWWHDNPQRAYPRWMANNRKCERMWWSGGGWTC